MSRISWKGGTLLSPVPPALITCSDGKTDNVFTVAWTGILNSDPPKTYISVRPSRFSHPLISESGEFVINLASEQMVRAVDLCGVRSGRDGDKFALARLTKTPSFQVACPTLAESPLALECRVDHVVPLGSHDMFIADIVGVSVEETLVDADGKLHLDRAHLLAYVHGEYFALGRRIGSFGCSVRKRRGPKDAHGTAKGTAGSGKKN